MSRFGRYRFPAAAAFLLAVGAARAASADVVKTTQGTQLEGKVVEQRPDAVVIETTFDGRKEVPRAQVASVDTSVPPLRDQLAWRLAHVAPDAAALLDLADWAKSKGFSQEVDEVWRRVVRADPKNVRAHKALGHVKVGDRWLTPEEKAAEERAAEEAALRAQGLVPYGDRWVTPQEKEALEKGLVRDGTEWVTEEEFHRRRGERRIDGVWTRVGEAEGRARCKALAQVTGTALVHLWGPHVDVYHDLKPEDGQAMLDAAEKGVVAFLRLVRAPEDPVADLRVEVAVFERLPGYVAYARQFAKEQAVEKIPGMETWGKSVQKQRAFWWTEPAAATGHTLFPDPPKVVASNVVHNLGMILVNRWRRAGRLAPAWLSEGVAYVVETQALEFSASYTVGRGGTGGLPDPTAWTDSAQWKASLATLVNGNQDTPAVRLAALPLGDFSLPDLVKAWSLVDYLVRLSAEKFPDFLEAAKAKGASADEALQAAYGFDLRALDERWRTWVRGGFQAP